MVIRKSLLISLVFLAFISSCAFTADKKNENIALGKKYTLSSKPNYSLTGDSGDMRQLTDGIYANAPGKSVWVQKATVGWSFMTFKPLAIAIDLGKVEPIDTVVYSTGARQFSGLWWPMVISIRVSENGKDFYEVGNMVRLSREPLPNTAGLRKHRFKATGLKTKGRWVMLIVQSSLMAVCDEIEVYRGDKADLARPYVGKPATLANFSNADYMTQEGCARRFHLDLSEVSRQLDAANIDEAARKKLRDIERELQDEIINTKFPSSAKSFRAILPYNDLHRQIMALNAYALRAKGLKGLTLWKNDRYAPLDWFEPPTKPAEPKPAIITMLNEHRADVINMTNATDKPMTVSFAITDLPGGINPAWLVPHQVEFVDTREGVVYGAALVKMTPNEGKYTTTVPTGMTRQIWFASHVKNVKPGEYSGKIEITSPDGNKRVPLALKVYPQIMPDQLDTAATIWDYANGKNYLVTENNLQACLADLKAHYVNAPWGSTWHVLFPSPKMFDDKGNMIEQPDFTAYDKWIKTWPNAKRYMVMLAVSPTRKFGEKFAPGTKEFENGLTQWAKAWQEHNRKLGLAPGRVVAQMIDEVHNHAQLVTSLQWSKVFRAAAPDIGLFNDPLISNITENDWPLFKELLKYTDVLCPQPVQYYRASKERQKDIQDFIAGENKKLWFYMCGGPVRRFNPAYYRLQPQFGFSVGGTGSGIWAYGDGRCESSWNEYPAVAKPGFTPVYLDRFSLTAGKHWEAYREGLEDTQYLIMLANATSIAKAKRLAKKLAWAYKTNANLGFDWKNANPCITADVVREKVLKLLNSVKEESQPKNSNK